MSTKQEIRCGTCRFWVESSGDGETSPCFYFPPAMAYDNKAPAYDRYKFARPQTFPDDFCGLWQETENMGRTSMGAELETGWISVEDRLPEYDEMVLIPGNKEHPVHVARTYKDEEFHYLDEWGGLCMDKIGSEVSYWMPVPPPPPKGGGK